MRKPYIKKLRKIGGVSVWLVDGGWVRENLDVDFTEGGNGYVKSYIPKSQAWIDDSMHRSEDEPVIVHEYGEINLRKKGIPYERAHKAINHVELALRKVKNRG